MSKQLKSPFFIPRTKIDEIKILLKVHEKNFLGINYLHLNVLVSKPLGGVLVPKTLRIRVILSFKYRLY